MENLCTRFIHDPSPFFTAFGMLAPSPIHFPGGMHPASSILAPVLHRWASFQRNQYSACGMPGLKMEGLLYKQFNNYHEGATPLYSLYTVKTSLHTRIWDWLKISKSFELRGYLS